MNKIYNNMQQIKNSSLHKKSHGKNGKRKTLYKI